MERHLVALLKELRPKRVLFTTFTFDVPFFDAAVLPVLENTAGCEISVLVDAKQLASGVVGVFSQDAGVNYAVAPVQAPGKGFFHPKIAFLETDEEQYICVGSGNLTAAGLSNQLECLDVVKCSSAPSTLKSFAEFLILLSSQVATSSPRASAILHKAGVRAGQAVKKFEGSNLGPRLIHTLREAANLQLIAEFKAKGAKAKRLTILSPFHSVDGKPIKELAKAIGTRLLRIGHDGTAPFEKDWYTGASNISPRVTFVTAKPADSRGSSGRLHAKVYELEADDGQTLVMSGSVNATHKSFETIENVEVSLARWYKQSPFKWRKQAPDRFVPVIYDGGSDCGLIVEAALQQGRCITGVITAMNGRMLPKMVRWAVFNADLLHETGSCRVGATPLGSLEISLKKRINPAHGSLKFEIQTDESTAYTWLNDEESLDVARTRVQVDARISRVIQGSVEFDDVHYVIKLLYSALAGQPISPLTISGRGTSLNGASGNETDGIFSYEEWWKSGTARRQPQRGLTSAPNVVKAILKLLSPKMMEPEGGGHLAGEDEDEDEDEPLLRALRRKTKARVATTKLSENLGLELSNACAQVKDAFDKQQIGIQGPVTLAMVVSAHEIFRAQKLRKSVQQVDGYQISIVRWIERLCRYQFDDQERLILLPIAAALSCFAAYQEAPIASPGAPSYARLSTLKFFLDKLAARQLVMEDYVQLVNSGLSNELFAVLEPDLRQKALECANKMASAPHMDDALVSHIHSVVNGEPTIRSDELAFPAVSNVLKEYQDSKRRWSVIYVADESKNTGGCVHCGVALNPEELNELKCSRVIRHPSGGSPGNAHLVVLPAKPETLRNSLGGLTNV